MAEQSAVKSDDYVNMPCPYCGKGSRLHAHQSGQVTCPGCHRTFVADTSKLVSPALLTAFGLVASWALIVQPWSPTPFSIASVFLISLAAAGVCHFLPAEWNARRREEERRQIDFNVFNELRLVFFIMAATSLGLFRGPVVNCVI